MLRLNRTTEYGLIALRHLSQKSAESAVCPAASAREIAALYGLPFDITAKTLQRLKETGLIDSAQGARGGYKLGRPLESTSLAEFLDLMEGPQNVVACVDDDAPACEYTPRCQIDGVLRGLNGQIRALLSGVMLSKFAEAPASASNVQFVSNFDTTPKAPVAPISNEVNA